MGLFKPDLYRSLAIGFLIGTLLVGVNIAPDILTPTQTAQASALSDLPR